MHPLKQTNFWFVYSLHKATKSSAILFLCRSFMLLGKKEFLQMSYAILRFAKLKTNGEIGGATSHAMRTRPTPNVVSGVSNKILWGTASPHLDIHEKIDAAKSRSNSVKCIEGLISASPEFFENMKKGQFKDWVNSSCRYIFETFGKENVAHVQLHLDESTPHLTYFVVPNKDGTLNARHWLGGKEKLQQRQDEYAAAVAHLGLDRGVRGSKATHQETQKYYGAQKAETPEWRDPTLLELAQGGGKWLDEIRSSFEQMQLSANSAKVERNKSKEQQKTLKNISERSQKTSVNLEKAKEQLDRLRALPLDVVASELALEKDTDDNFKDAEKRFAITINGRKFFDHKSASGGGGSIDLVKHCLDCDFNEAKAWLVSRFGGDALLSEAIHEAQRDVKKIKKELSDGTVKAFKPPAPVPENWEAVRRYLNRARGLSGKLLDGLFKQGKLYADRFSNIVFSGERSAALRGTNPNKPFKGLAVGSDKSEAWRCVVGRDEDKHKCLVIGESPIDALSYAQMHDIRGTIAATHGIASMMPKNLQAGAWQKTIIAYDRDDAGKRAATKLKSDIEERGFPNVVIHHPMTGKDWNDEMLTGYENFLKKKRGSNGSESDFQPRTEPKPPKM